MAAILSEDVQRALLRELLATTGRAWVTCAGRSMEPTIRLGDRVRIEACARVRAGDVVLFETSRGHVLHRVVFTLPGTPWLLHIGDAGSGTGPGLVHASQVVGRAQMPRRLVPGPVLWQGAMHVTRALWRAARRAARPGSPHQRA